MSYSFYFYDYSNLKYFPDISKFTINKVTNMCWMFGCCEKLESLTDVSAWDISNAI